MKFLPLLLLPLSAMALKLPKPPKAMVLKDGKQVCAGIEKLMKQQVVQQQPVEFSVNKKLKIKGKIGATGPGNGTFNLVNLYLRVYHTRADGMRIKDKCLTIEFVDLDKDGFRDVQISGTVQSVDEKENAKVVGETVFNRAYLFLPTRKVFVPTSGSPNPYVELVIR
jgi:hypothetical protein